MRPLSLSASTVRISLLREPEIRIRQRRHDRCSFRWQLLRHRNIRQYRRGYQISIHPVSYTHLSVQLVLKAIYETNSFATYGGKLTYFNASNDGIGLPTTVLDGSSSNAFDRFKNFTADDYSKVYATVKAGNLGLVRTITVANESGYATEEELVSGLNLVKVAPKVIK